MSTLTGADIASEVPGLFAAKDAADANLTQKILKVRPKYNYSIAVAIAANGALEAGAARAEADAAVTHFEYYPGANLTASSTVNATITLERATAAGVITSMGVTTTKPTAQSGTGNWTKGIPVALNITAASAFVSAGDMLLIKVAQTSTGTAIPQGAFSIDGVYT